MGQVAWCSFRCRNYGGHRQQVNVTTAQSTAMHDVTTQPMHKHPLELSCEF